MYLCACMRGLKRPRCSCKDFESVAANNGSILDEAMHTCVCDVGKTFDKCSNHVHIMALDYRAGTFEAINELGRAQRDAEWMLELAPRMPDVHANTLADMLSALADIARVTYGWAR